MGSPFFHEFKKQASFFLKEKIRTVRLALIDVTPAQLLTEEVTNGNTWTPDTSTLGSISRAAFELDDYWRIVEILHNKEYIRNKSERILKLLQKGPALKEERARARKLTRGIQGFGSFSYRSSSEQGNLKDSSYGRSNSDFNHHETDNSKHYNDNAPFEVGNKYKNFKSWSCFNEGHGVEKPEIQTSFKENMAVIKEQFHNWTAIAESNPLLGRENNELRRGIMIEDDVHHPFNSHENQTASSMLLPRNGIVQGC
ncbi:hypothetical protein Gorai_011512 [Gossypium raimondii]|uniref:ENTH domain-containing protein n=1 Tax=Gossypium raimondii TaxID=29730 RepID=A0A0D2UJ66_GOSRA|nr:hypothetical protein B456_009G099500 [Gossypium raimondii]MBA0594612.1 hypothetical protein [Gossypium raimondii]